MDRKVFHGALRPAHISQALLGEFNRANLYAQAFDQGAKTIVQIASRRGAASGGQTAMTVTVESVEDGIMVELGEQALLGVAASLGLSAWSALRNPFSLLGRLDDIAQDIENLQLADKIWRVIDRAASAAGASAQLSDRLKRIACEYCGAANPVGEAACLSCGAPLGSSQPQTCKQCGFVLLRSELVCPNCKQATG